MTIDVDRPAWPRVSPCLHCRILVLHDNDGTPIHANLSYVCRDPSGQVAATTATPEPRPASGKADAPGRR